MEKILPVLEAASVYALGHLADVHQYGKSWGDEFCRKEALRNYEKALEHLKNFAFKSLTLDELNAIGFRMWNKGLILCPLWAAPLLIPNLKDNDTRFGCVAYGWKVENEKVMWDKEGTIG